jgi:hypothetical protein
MRHLILIKHEESLRSQTIPQALMDAMGTFVTDAMKRGVMLDTAGLRPTAEASDVRIRKGKLSVIDGPFTEAKEIVGGYAMLDVKSREEALALAKEFMELHRVHWPEFEGACEVRQLEDYDPA